MEGDQPGNRKGAQVGINGGKDCVGEEKDPLREVGLGDEIGQVKKRFEEGVIDEEVKTFSKGREEEVSLLSRARGESGHGKAKV